MIDEAKPEQIADHSPTRPSDSAKKVKDEQLYEGVLYNNNYICE